MTHSGAQLSAKSRILFEKWPFSFDKYGLTWENKSGPGDVGRNAGTLTQRPDSSRRWDGAEPYPAGQNHSRLRHRDHPMSRDGARKLCPTALKHQLIKDQEGLCAYCLIPFGSIIQYGRRYKLSVVNFDHMLPFAYTNNNLDTNWAAACNFCNGMKGSKVFKSVDDIRDYVLGKWTQRRMCVVWEAPVSSELDPYRWAVKFGTFLAGLPPKLAGSITYVKPYTRAKPKAASKVIFPTDPEEQELA